MYIIWIIVLWLIVFARLNMIKIFHRLIKLLILGIWLKHQTFTSSLQDLIFYLNFILTKILANLRPILMKSITIIQFHSVAIQSRISCKVLKNLIVNFHKIWITHIDSQKHTWAAIKWHIQQINKARKWKNNLELLSILP